MGDEHKYILQAMDTKLSKVEDKQDKLLDVVAEQNEILAKMQVIQEQHHASLEEHHRRTTLNEDRLLILERRDEHFQAFTKGAVWILGLLISAATAINHFFN
jgi:hypothetical protein